MTGLELICKQGSSMILFKVRHDGYAIEEFLTKKRVSNIFNLTPRQVMDDFIDWFFDPKKYGPVQDGDIDTMFPRGFEFSKIEEAEDPFEYFEQASITSNKLYEEGKIKTPLGEDYDGFQCGYQDYMILIDFDKKEIFNSSDD